MLGKSTGVWLACVGSLALAACADGTGGDPTDATDETDDLPTGDDDDDDDVQGPVRDDDGSVVLASWGGFRDAPAASTVLAGLFVEDALGWANLAQCASMPQAFCATALPQNPGESVLVLPFDPSLIGSLTTRDVGEGVGLGPLEAERELVDGQTYYYGAWATAELPTGDLGLSLAGDWGPYAGSADVASPTPMEVTLPDPMALTEFFDSEPIHLAWTPGTEGDVFLMVTTLLEKRMYRLEDTGSYDLDLTPLGLPDRTDVDLVLGRWSSGSVDHDGHEVSLLVQSNQQLRGQWRTVGSRAELTVHDRCADAQAAPSAVSGNYFANLRGFSNDLDPLLFPACVGAPMTAGEGVFPVDLDPDHRLSVSYTVAEDGGLYFVTDCNRVGTCFAGSNTIGGGWTESAQYINEGTETERIYVVLDGYLPGPIQSQANVDITIEALGGDILEPTCAEAMAQGPAQPGNYSGSIEGNADLLDPECVGASGGGEGLVQVYLLPEQTLTATVTTPGANPSTYLLYNCSIADSCFESQNTNPTPDSETITYQNLSGFSEFVYLAVDSAGSAGTYVLDIAIQ